MGVKAICSDCRDEHPLGDRLTDPDRTTTTCPNCRSTSYSSEPVDAETLPSERDRIHDAVADIRGVGQKNLKHLQNTFGLYVELETASVDDLTEVQGIGEKTAERIVEATS